MEVKSRATRGGDCLEGPLSQRKSHLQAPVSWLLTKLTNAVCGGVATFLLQESETVPPASQGFIPLER